MILHTHNFINNYYVVFKYAVLLMILISRVNILTELHIN